MSRLGNTRGTGVRMVKEGGRAAAVSGWSPSFVACKQKFDGESAVVYCIADAPYHIGWSRTWRFGGLPTMLPHPLHAADNYSPEGPRRLQQKQPRFIIDETYCLSVSCLLLLLFCRMHVQITLRTPPLDPVLDGHRSKKQIVMHGLASFPLTNLVCRSVHFRSNPAVRHPSPSFSPSSLHSHLFSRS